MPRLRSDIPDQPDGDYFEVVANVPPLQAFGLFSVTRSSLCAGIEMVNSKPKGT